MYILVFNYAKLLKIAIETGRVDLFLLYDITCVDFWILVCS